MKQELFWKLEVLTRFKQPNPNVLWNVERTIIMPLDPPLSSGRFLNEILALIRIFYKSFGRHSYRAMLLE